MRYVPGVKISGCTSYIYTWVEIIIDAERTLGYSVYTIKNNYMIGLKNTKRLKNLIGMHGLILFYKDWLNKLYDIETCPSPNMVYAVRTFGVHQNTRLRQAHRIH